MSRSIQNEELFVGLASVSKAPGRRHHHHHQHQHQHQHQQNAVQRVIAIEPTPEYQQFYNKKRQEMDKRRLQTHTAKEDTLGSLPQVELMSSSAASDAPLTPSIKYSHPGDGHTAPYYDAMTEAARAKPHRGRRKGPLDIDTRIKTAFKRKFKLTCDFHREKRTSCNCHDFSKLEEGYNSLATEEHMNRTAQDLSASQHDRSSRSPGDLGTFGTGGAAQTTPWGYQGPESAELTIGDDELSADVQENLRLVVNFDLNSASSLNEFMSVPFEQSFSSVMPTMRNSTRHLLHIGSRWSEFHDRWQCEYRCTEGDTGSLDQPSSCAWTGPLKELCSHYHNQHRTLQSTAPTFWSLCLQCNTETGGLVKEPLCAIPNQCPPGSWLNRCFCAAAHTSSRHAASTSSALSAVGRNLHPLAASWDSTTIGSSVTGPYNRPYNYSIGTYSRYEASAWWNGSKAGDDEEATNYSYDMYRT
ncbi:hypothetical protein GGR50DRAFT_667132 [Xylaria sp. CBS 124048]|nr:hypothetical protein GGR50DRAFT_667132 [Xylaria sp. CBS 124048]